MSLIITDLTLADLDALLEGAPPAVPPGPGPAMPGPPRQQCPTCGRDYDLFDHDTSRLLDWIARLDYDLHNLKRAVEEVLP